MRGHRRRLPPGGDPHHAVRRGAATGVRRAGRRHVQRARSRGEGRRVEGRRRVVGVGARAGRELPDDRAAPSLQQPDDLRRGQGLQRRAAAQLRRDVRPATTSRCATSTSTDRAWTSTAPTPRCSSAGWSASPPGSRRSSSATAPQTMDFVHVHDIARANILAAKSRRHATRSSTSPAAPKRACCELAASCSRVMGSSLEPEHAPARKVNGVPRRLADTQQGDRTARLRSRRSRSRKGFATWSTGGRQSARRNGGGRAMNDVDSP